MFIVDTHCDTLSALANKAVFTGENANTMIRPERLKSGNVGLQTFAIFAGVKGPEGEGDEAPAALAKAQEAVIPLLKEAGLKQVMRPRDAVEGENSFMLSIEGGEVFGEDLDELRRYRELGVRICSLTWNNINSLAYPHCKNGQRPLKRFGQEAVQEMNRLGIAVDVSHLGEGGFWDLIYHNELPPMASHSCCRALCPQTRNLTDDQLRALIERGGWVGINFYTAFLTSEKTSSIEDIVRHIDHVVELGGIHNVGFGSDFDGIDSAPVDLQHPGCFPALLDALKKRGYSQEEIDGFCAKNFMRYMAQFELEAHI